MNRVLRFFFFLLFVKPFVTIILGTNVKRADLLPRTGPAILVANHNSHLDTFVLMSLFPMHMLTILRPVAAADYFLRNRVLAWFVTRIIGVIPLDRTGHTAGHAHPLAVAMEALDRGEILILFPEGTRGEPEQLSKIKSGVAHLVKSRPSVPVVPVFIYGLGKALPRGEALLVPCICDISVGEPIPWCESRSDYMQTLRDSFDDLADETAAAHHETTEEDESNGESM